MLAKFMIGKMAKMSVFQHTAATAMTNSRPISFLCTLSMP